MNKSNEKEINFSAWINLLDDRIEDWLGSLSFEERSSFDYSIESLDEIERYMISKFSLEDLQENSNKKEIDAIASYVLKTFENNWSKSEFVIELKDKKNILFNRPAITVLPKRGMAFSPYQFMPSIINLGRVGGFQQVLKSKSL